MKTTVVNRRTDRYDVYIGRPTMWGNPYKIGRDGSRQEVIAKFEDMARRTYSNDSLRQLIGKRLGCWCAPEPCHGDVLAKMAEEVRAADSRSI